MSYGGDVTPKECWEMLEQDSEALLIDVRTKPEWAFVGIPALDESMQEIVLREWQVFPEMHVDENFTTGLGEEIERRGGGKETKLCFLCRSGVRSLAAAREMTASGYPNTYNISGGFEGGLDGSNHRGTKEGWKAEGFPWRQN